MFNSLFDIQYNNMFKSINSFLYEYHCMMSIIDNRIEKKTISIKDGHRKTKKEYDCNEYLLVNGNGNERICTISKEDGKFCIYLDGTYPWSKDKPYQVCDSEKTAIEAIELICRDHYYKKYGEMRTFREYLPGKKRLSVGEICDWFNQFIKLDMSINEIEAIVAENKRIKKELDYYEKMLDTVHRRVVAKKGKEDGET